jgi:DNA helicase-2/ATP-dependent DNA helicase PcrA
MSDILNSLNPVQREAVQNYDGAALIIAGAGSGKTRVLTHRIAYMLECRVRPYNVLALTFTNKAAREMRERISTLVDPQTARALWMGTFHSVFNKILRIEAEHLGFTSNFTIYDPADSKSVLRTIVRDLGLDEKIYKESSVHNRISYAKNNLITPQLYARSAEQMSSDNEWHIPRMHEVYAAYTQYCKNADAMDFDDLLLYTNILFKNNPDVLQKYVEKFHYILVDEYQDTNFAQYLIVQMLSAQRKNLCVVGDDAQSIYSFRGANIQNILNFKKDYPQCKIFKLEQNYRSTQNIVNAANSLIAKNSGQLQKTCFSAGAAGEKIKIIQCESDHEEGFRIAGDIEDRHMEDRAPYSDFAILYRTNAQSRIFEDALRRKNIPYKIYAGMSFYQRKEIKDTLAYLRIIVNHKDNEAFKRIVNYPKRGIGDTTIEHIETAAGQRNQSMWECILSMTPDSAGITGAAYKKIAAFLIMIDTMRQQASDKNAYDLAQEIVQKAGIWDDLRSEKNAVNVARIENVEELLNSIKAFCETYSEENGTEPHIAQYLETVSLLTDADNDNPEDRNCVTLMTVHSAKGLEFGYVYVVGMEEGLFPTSNMYDAQKEMEEERRLFYVALTRAKRRAAISFANTRMKWGKIASASVSRFVKELDARYLDLPMSWHNSHGAHIAATISDDDNFSFPYRKNTVNNTVNNFKPAQNVSGGATAFRTAASRSVGTGMSPAEITKICVGTKVQHERFGTGEVVAIDNANASGDSRATIRFAVAGTKVLLLKFARLAVVA